jgi:Flp pilus assembly protein CpaB
VSAQALPPLASPLVTREGVLVGTLAYMSPEQLDGKPADERSDQFSFCVALGEALTGTRPFSGENWSDLAISQAAAPTLRTVDRRLREVLRRGLQRDPSRRFTSMAALLAELERKPTRRPTMLAAAAAAGVAMMAAVVAVAPGVRSRLPFVGAGYKQWVPVVCAARDLPAGTLITMDMVQQRSLPPEAVSKSNITPEAVQFIVGQVVHTNVYGGDALLWSEFETVEDGQRDVMVAVNDLPVGAVLTEADVRTRRVDAALATESVVKPDSARFLVGQRLVSPLKQGDLVTWSAFETVEQGQREVLVAAEDLAEGAIVTSSNVVARKVDAALATNSVVKSDSTALVLGQRVHAQLQKGDLLLWSQFELDDPKPNQQSAVMAVVLGHKPQLEQCIQAERAAHPDGKGKVVMSWTVAPDGSVRGVGTKTPGMKGSSLVSCLSAAIATWRFPVGEVDAVIDFPFQY